MRGVSLGGALLFSLFSFLFGGTLVAFRETLRGTLAAFGLLPAPVSYPSPFPRLEKKPVPEKAKPPRKGKKPTAPQNQKNAKSKTSLSGLPKAPKSPKLSKNKKRPKRAPGCPMPFFFGYLAFDLSFFVLGGAAYMVFLYAENGGIFRLYALLLTVCGFLALRPAVLRFLARPLFCALSFLFFLARFLFTLFLFPLVASRFRFERKSRKRLDEETKMV